MIKINKNILDGIHNLLTNNSKQSSWLYSSEDKTNVYLVKNKHFIKFNFIQTLDIVMIEVESPGKGIGTAILNYIHENNPYKATFVDSVINHNFENWLKKNHWKPYMDDCYYKLSPAITNN